MDKFFLRFLHLAEQIFEKLDDRSLLRSRVVARSWKGFIDYKDYPLIRIQNMVADLRKNCKDDWETAPRLSFANPFHLTCGKGQVKLAKVLMIHSARLGISMNAKNRVGFTAFHFACIHGHYNVVKMLLKNSMKFNIDLNAKENNFGRTAIHYAFIYDHSKIAKMLMKNSTIFNKPFDHKLYHFLKQHAKSTGSMAFSSPFRGGR